MSTYNIGDNIEMFDVFGRSLLKAELADPLDNTFQPVQDKEGIRYYYLCDASGTAFMSIADYTHWLRVNDERWALIQVPSNMVYVWCNAILSERAYTAPIPELKEALLNEFYSRKPEWEHPHLSVTCEIHSEANQLFSTFRVFAESGFKFADAIGEFHY